MQSLLTLAPLAVFLIAYQVGDIYLATAALMIAMLAVVAIDWLRTRHVPAVHGFSLLLVLIFGSLTLWLRDVHFIQWKPTILFGLLGVAHIASEFIGRRVLAERLMAELVPEFKNIEARNWRLANRALGVYYWLLAYANWWVANHLSEAIWVKFKAIGLTLLLMAFFVALSYWLMRRPEIREQQQQS
jgi:intracellular septation protein